MTTDDEVCSSLSVLVGVSSVLRVRLQLRAATFSGLPPQVLLGLRGRRLPAVAGEGLRHLFERRGEDGVLRRRELADPLEGEVDQGVHLLAAEAPLLPRPLNLDQRAAGGGDDVHVDLRHLVLDVLEVEPGDAADDADRDRGDLVADRPGGDVALVSASRPRARTAAT